MVETALNIAWLACATAALIAAPRCTPRVRIALFCSVALLFPIISITDDFSSDSALMDALALAVFVMIAIVLVELRHVHSAAAPAYRHAFRTLSDPRSPPR